MSPEHEKDPWRATGLEPPVFLDRTGRRGRVVSLVGRLAALATAAWLLALAIGAVGFLSLPTQGVTTRGVHLHRPASVFVRATVRPHGTGAGLLRIAAAAPPDTEPEGR